MQSVQNEAFKSSQIGTGTKTLSKYAKTFGKYAKMLASALQKFWCAKPIRYLYGMKKSHMMESEKVERVDPLTGEILQVESKKLVKLSMTEEDEFYMVFCKTIAGVYELNYADDLKMIIKLNQIAEFNSGRVSISAGMRQSISTELGIHTSNISKSLKRLTDKMLISGDRGEYVINPKVFWKGDRKMRQDVLRKEGLRFTMEFKIEPNENYNNGTDKS